MNDFHIPPSRPMPLDQAQGLRRIFGDARQRLVPLVANPFVPGAGALLEVAASALAQRGHRVLVVDAASTAHAPRETALFDLSACVEVLTPQLSYLAARGLPLAFVDTRGSAAGFLAAIASAMPQADVVLLQADPSDMARLLAHRAARPVLLGANRLDSIKQAYAACKLLTQRCGLMTFDLLLSAAADGSRTRRIVQSLADCADGFLGAVLHDWAVVDPLGDARAPHDDSLARLLAGQLALEDEIDPVAATAAGRNPTGRRAATRSQRLNGA
jgi:flagellar biosynthesis protein FlhG